MTKQQIADFKREIGQLDTHADQVSFVPRMEQYIQLGIVDRTEGEAWINAVQNPATTVATSPVDSAPPDSASEFHEQGVGEREGWAYYDPAEIRAYEEAVQLNEARHQDNLREIDFIQSRQQPVSGRQIFSADPTRLQDEEEERLAQIRRNRELVESDPSRLEDRRDEEDLAVSEVDRFRRYGIAGERTSDHAEVPGVEAPEVERVDDAEAVRRFIESPHGQEYMMGAQDVADRATGDDKLKQDASRTLESLEAERDTVRQMYDRTRRVRLLPEEAKEQIRSRLKHLDQLIKGLRQASYDVQGFEGRNLESLRQQLEIEEGKAQQDGRYRAPGAVMTQEEAERLDRIARLRTAVRNLEHSSPGIGPRDVARVTVPFVGIPSARELTALGYTPAQVATIIAGRTALDAATLVLPSGGKAVQTALKAVKGAAGNVTQKTIRNLALKHPNLFLPGGEAAAVRAGFTPRQWDDILRTLPKDRTVSETLATRSTAPDVLLGQQPLGLTGGTAGTIRRNPILTTGWGKYSTPDPDFLTRMRSRLSTTHQPDAPRQPSLSEAQIDVSTGRFGDPWKVQTASVSDTLKSSSRFTDPSYWQQFGLHQGLGRSNYSSVVPRLVGDEAFDKRLLLDDKRAPTHGTTPEPSVTGDEALDRLLLEDLKQRKVAGRVTRDLWPEGDDPYHPMLLSESEGGLTVATSDGGRHVSMRGRGQSLESLKGQLKEMEEELGAARKSRAEGMTGAEIAAYEDDVMARVERLKEIVRTRSGEEEPPATWTPYAEDLRPILPDDPREIEEAAVRLAQQENMRQAWGAGWGGGVAVADPDIQQATNVLSLPIISRPRTTSATPEQYTFGSAFDEEMSAIGKWRQEGGGALFLPESPTTTSGQMVQLPSGVSVPRSVLAGLPVVEAAAAAGVRAAAYSDSTTAQPEAQPIPQPGEEVSTRPGVSTGTEPAATPATDPATSPFSDPAAIGAPAPDPAAAPFADPTADPTAHPAAVGAPAPDPVATPSPAEIAAPSPFEAPTPLEAPAPLRHPAPLETPAPRALTLRQIDPVTRTTVDPVARTTVDPVARTTADPAPRTANPPVPFPAHTPAPAPLDIDLPGPGVPPPGLPPPDTPPPPEKEFPKGPGLPDDETPQQEREPEPAPRPSPDHFPRAIEHVEQVEYRHNAETGDYDARLLQASKPVVTSWDQSAPDTAERPVGSWNVSPTPNGVEASANAGAYEIPDDVRDKLQELARENGGEPVSVTLRVSHDLDTDTTTATAYVSEPNRNGTGVENPDGTLAGMSTNEQKAQGGGRYAALARNGRSGSAQSGEPDPIAGRYQALANLMKQQAEPQRGGGRRRASSRKDGLKESGYKLPTIEIQQEAMGGRRKGRL